jgi:hypothetical protein
VDHLARGSMKNAASFLEVGFSGWFEIGSPVTKRSTLTGCPH